MRKVLVSLPQPSGTGNNYLRNQMNQEGDNMVINEKSLFFGVG
jgi:hypothetical protein